MKEYNKPELKITSYEAKDIITASDPLSVEKTQGTVKDVIKYDVAF